MIDDKTVAGRNTQTKTPKTKIPPAEILKVPEYPSPKTLKPEYPMLQNTQGWNSRTC